MTEDLIRKTIQEYNETAAQYAEGTFDVNKFPGLIRYLEKFLHYTKANELILDVGSGSGRDLNYFIDNNRRAIGIDMSEKLIEEAKKRMSADVLLMNMRKPAFKNNTFDGLWSCASFLHISKSEAESTLYEFKRVLKPGRVMYISVKEGEGENTVNGKFYSYYQEQEIINLINSAGFSVLHVSKNQDYRSTNWINVFAKKSL